MKAFITALLTGCSTAKTEISSVNRLLEKNISVSIHKKNLQALATEMYKTSNNMFPITINDIFAPRATSYNLSNPVSFKMQNVHLVYNDTETLSHLGPKIWSLILHEIWDSLYHLVILNQKSNNKLDLIVPAVYSKKYLH